MNNTRETTATFLNIIHSEHSQKHALYNAFWFRPISRSVPKIQLHKVTCIFNRRKSKNYEWRPDLHFFQEMRTLGSKSSSLTSALLTTLGLVSGREWEVRECERDSDRKSSKNSVPFERRYLGNGKSDRDETKTILQGKVRSFRRFELNFDAFVCSGIIIVETFGSFNRRCPGGIWSLLG